MKKLKLGIVGATGLVGQTVLQVLFEENMLDEFEVFLIASEKTAGRRYYFKNREYNIISLTEKCLGFGLDFAIFSAGDDVGKFWAKRFVQKNCVVIDNSNAFRNRKEVPLIVPEINANEIKHDSRIISNPNCSTIQLAVVLDRLKALSKIEQVVVSTYQSVSGAGKLALMDHKNGTNFYFVNGIKDNIIPQIGALDEHGFCTEENKIIFELNKILKTNIHVCATAVRVPVSNCHGESVYVRFENEVFVDDVKKVLNEKHINLSNGVVSLLDCVGTNQTYVCRLKQVSANEIMFFVVADNLRRGAAYNAVMILKQAKSLLFDRIWKILTNLFV